jgi:arabinofuranan 3-O-arabinosyltransferase
VDGRPPVLVTLDNRSRIVGQRVDFAPTDGPTTIRIALGELTAGAPGGRTDRTGVGFAEIDTGLGPSPEVVSVPTDLTNALREAGIEQPVTYVLTRERVGPTDRWRSDPEWTIVRDIDVPFEQAVAVRPEVRVDLRAGDAVLAELLGIEGPLASARLTGAPSAAGWAAADGDPSTAWTTPFGTVVGSRLTVTLLDPGAPLRIDQPGGDHSTITRLTVRQGDMRATVEVPAPDADGWSTVELPSGLQAGALQLRIDAITERTTRDRRYADTVVLPAAIAELTNVAPTEMPASFSTGCRDDLVAVDGVALPVRLDGDVAAALAGEPLEANVCARGELALTAGVHRVSGQQDRRAGLQVDRVVLDGGTPDAEGGAASEAMAAPSVTVTRAGRIDRTVEVADCPAGCWLILGEGYDDGWAASIDGASLGPPTLVSGGFNGWRIPAHEGTVTVHIEWTRQRPLDVALVVSALAVVTALVLAVRDRSGRAPPPLAPPALEPFGPSDGILSAAIAAAAYVAAAAVFVSPGYWVWGAAGGALVLATRRARCAGYVAIGAMALIAWDVVTFVRREHPAATPSFPGHFEHLHLLGLFAAVSIGVSMLSRPRRDDVPPPEPVT